MNREHLFPLAEAIVVTFLWSSSYVLVKIGLTNISPLNLVALRYIIASAVLVPIAFLKQGTNVLRDTKSLLKIVFLGISGYTIAQGLQCVGLFYLPAVFVSFILNFTPVLVLIFGTMVLKEYPTMIQLIGVVIVLVGAALFFDTPFLGSNLLGVVITFFSGVGWAIYLVFSRFLFLKEEVRPLGLTAYTMGLGTLFMGSAAYVVEGFSDISLSGWLIIIWLAVVNTALAFFLWNRALERLEAFKISVLQNTMLIQIAILSFLFLEEPLTTTKVISICIVFISVLMVQLKKLN